MHSTCFRNISFSLIVLIFIIGCGDGGGGSSSVPSVPDTPNIPAVSPSGDYTDKPEKSINIRKFTVSDTEVDGITGEEKFSVEYDVGMTGGMTHGVDFYIIQSDTVDPEDLVNDNNSQVYRGDGKKIHSDFWATGDLDGKFEAVWISEDKRLETDRFNHVFSDAPETGLYILMYVKVNDLDPFADKDEMDTSLIETRVLQIPIKDLGIIE